MQRKGWKNPYLCKNKVRKFPKIAKKWLENSLKFDIIIS